MCVKYALMANGSSDVTQLLVRYGSGDRSVLDQLLPLVYDELKRIAAIYMSRERRDHTLQPTALVNEAYLRLMDQRNVDWRNRAQFFGLAASMMRRILVNYAIAHKAEKRGNGGEKVSLDEVGLFLKEQNLDILALDEALTRLGELDEQKANVVEMKFFGGLTTAEIAEATERSTASIERDWTFARTWLYKELN
mgnify:CR=1 FL=1